MGPQLHRHRRRKQIDPVAQNRRGFTNTSNVVEDVLGVLEKNPGTLARVVDAHAQCSERVRCLIVATDHAQRARSEQVRVHRIRVCGGGLGAAEGEVTVEPLERAEGGGEVELWRRVAGVESQSGAQQEIAGCGGAGVEGVGDAAADELQSCRGREVERDLRVEGMGGADDLAFVLSDGTDEPGVFEARDAVEGQELFDDGETQRPGDRERFEEPALIVVEDLEAAADHVAQQRRRPGWAHQAPPAELAHQRAAFASGPHELAHEQGVAFRDPPHLVGDARLDRPAEQRGDHLVAVLAGERSELEPVHVAVLDQAADVIGNGLGHARREQHRSLAAGHELVHEQHGGGIKKVGVIHDEEQRLLAGPHAQRRPQTYELLGRALRRRYIGVLEMQERGEGHAGARGGRHGALDDPTIVGQLVGDHADQCGLADAGRPDHQRRALLATHGSNERPEFLSPSDEVLHDPPARRGLPGRASTLRSGRSRSNHVMAGRGDVAVDGPDQRRPAQERGVGAGDAVQNDPDRETVRRIGKAEGRSDVARMPERDVRALLAEALVGEAGHEAEAELALAFEHGVVGAGPRRRAEGAEGFATR